MKIVITITYIVMAGTMIQMQQIYWRRGSGGVKTRTKEFRARFDYTQKDPTNKVGVRRETIK